MSKSSQTTQARSNRRKMVKTLGLGAGAALVAPTMSYAGRDATPTQVEGPFYPVHEAEELDADLTRIVGRSEQAEGQTILVTGQVLDREGKPVANALVDVWQANHHGRYIHPEDTNTAPLDPNFQGWAKVQTNADGRYKFKTIKPGAYRTAAGEDADIRCQHIHFKVSRAGFKELTTQMYFADDPLLEKDFLVANTPKAQREQLICNARTDAETGLPDYSFEIVLQTT